MTQTGLILSVFIALYAFLNTAQAGTISVSLSSNKPIVHSMDLAVSSNSFSYLYAQGTGIDDSTYKMSTASKPVKLKSPTMALLIALVPGAVVHGSGHFYAGKPGTGAFLFSLELISAGLIYAGALRSFGEQSENSGSSKDGTGIEFIGFALFVGSWLYDLIESPFVVKNRNDRILSKEPFE